MNFELARKLLLFLLALLLVVFSLLPKEPLQRSVNSQPTSAVKPQVNRLAIVIDDIGYSIDRAQPFFNAPATLNFAVIPDAPHAPKLSRQAHLKGHQVIIHMPMEPLERDQMPPRLIRVDMDEAAMLAELEYAMSRVPFSVGINNHMGSRFTAQTEPIKRLLNTIKQQPLLFTLDSRTIANSKLYPLSRQANIPTLARDIFLDNDRSSKAINRQLDKLLALAKKRGQAIGIGHPYEETAMLLPSFLQRTKEAGVAVVPLSEFIVN